MTKITRKEDAASIVGASLADEIDAKNKVQALKLDAMIEMSESEPTEEETKELIAEAEGEPTPEVEEKSETKPEEVPVQPVAEEKSMEEEYLPYGGAVSMKEAQQAQEAKKEMIQVMDMFSMFQNVVWNIIDRSDVKDKKAACTKAVDEFKSMLAAKAMVEFSVAQPVPVVEKSEIDQHELKPALDVLLATIDNSLNLEGDVNAKLQLVQPVLQELGEAITDYVGRKSVISEPPAQDKNQDNLLEEIKKIIQPISERLASVEAKSNAANVQTKSRIPQPRTMSSSVVKKAETTSAEEKPKPGSLKSIVRKSVGIVE